MKFSQELEAIREKVDAGELGPEEARAHLPTLCAAMAGCGLTQLTVCYAGSYESGEVTDVSFEPEDAALPEELHDLLQKWTFAILPDGWDYDVGSCGQVTIDVAASRAEVDHEWYVVSTEEESYEIG